jgi:hypothetical protein
MTKQVVLEGFIGDTLLPWDIAFDAFPYLIGRDNTYPLHINTGQVKPTT